jgi:outer membrane protein assembly factor BamB
VRWKKPLPAKGNSTPVVWGERVFVTQAVEEQRSVFCFDRSDGRLRWQKGVSYTEKEISHDTNPYNSSSPVTDGERVVVWYGSAGLYCYDLDGKELWHRDLGHQRHIWGWGSSPVLVGDLCLLNFGPGEPSFLVAMDKKTGREIWRLNAPDADAGEKKPGQEKAVWAGSWSTPLVASIGGQEQVIMTWPRTVTALESKIWPRTMDLRRLESIGIYIAPV